MHFQPTPRDGDIQAGAVFRGRAPVDVQKETVELLDIDSTILNRFESVCVLQEATGGRLFRGRRRGGQQSVSKLSLTFSNAW
jgi:hypothetical protein